MPKYTLMLTTAMFITTNTVADLLLTVEPRFNEPLYNEVLGITNDIFQPSNRVMYGREPRYNEPLI